MSLRPSFLVWNGHGPGQVILRWDVGEQSHLKVACFHAFSHSLVLFAGQETRKTVHAQVGFHLAKSAVRKKKKKERENPGVFSSSAFTPKCQRNPGAHFSVRGAELPLTEYTLQRQKEVQIPRAVVLWPRSHWAGLE